MIVKKPIQYAVIIDRQGDCGVFDTMEDAIKLAHVACDEYKQCSEQKKNEIVDSVIKELELHLEEVSLMTCKENGSSSYSNILYNNTNALDKCLNDKYLESRLSIINCDNSYTVNGVIVEASNPIETIIKNSILMLKAGHAVVFSSNEDVKEVFSYTIKLINRAIEAVGGPRNLVVTVKKPSVESTDILVSHEKIILISAIDNQDTRKIAL
ncbi:aldehyde dehydrogenase family protein [Clostridium beijerinckii]|uniref:Propionaldehyde dehydrogenase n=1 Tax=Clostridium beijerinckii TaxID=1520 RepID=A0AAE5H4I2_CLOBE|nr:aldehyde dehydrogenase family protein [Clostridium beijerinckii]NSB14871.1 propionaldehyde dehydrogenase [Clostridium beijerinckii]OOM32743.1 aldehyde-alcohol dehydrogenase [Clostridium beijerinckii]